MQIYNPMYTTFNAERDAKKAKPLAAYIIAVVDPRKSTKNPTDNETTNCPTNNILPTMAMSVPRPRMTFDGIS